MQFSEILKGTLQDVKSTHKMFTSITDVLLHNQIDQWNYDYPDPETLTKDVESGYNFIIRHGDEVVASIALNAIQDEQYKFVLWSKRDKDVLVIHRLGVHPDYQGHGLGKKMCLFAEKYAKENGYKNIRLDAYSGNPISNSMYEKLGYKKANGYCYFRKKAIPFYCYEKEV